MAHANAPLTPEGRRRLIERIILDGRPISHVAAEAGVSRQRLSIWLHRFELLGEAGLEDRSSRPARSPNQTPEEIGDDRPHSAIGNRPPISRAPDAGPRLTHDPIVLSPDRAGQLALDLDPDNNVP